MNNSKFKIQNSKFLTILGAGESGVGAAILAKKQGYKVFVSDKGKIQPEYKKLLKKHKLDWEERKHSSVKIYKSDEVVKSPGIPDDSPLILKLKEKKIPIISEIEFAYRYANGKIIAITGSNGKTTTTSLIHHIFKAAGMNVGLGGNIGYSFARQVAEKKYDYHVLEISSFQLDGIVKFKPDVAILLNITPDHLDRYNYKLGNYVKSKFLIAKNQTPDDYFIYCSDDPVTTQYFDKFKIKSTCLPFSLKKKPGSVGFANKTKLIVNHKTHFEMPLTDLSIKGNHNVYNSLAACIASKIFDLKKDVIRESMMDFRGLEHRLEFVARVMGVEYVNDSKATNVNSTWYALESMTKPVILIAGGVDKGNDYSILTDMIKKKVKAIICLGENNLKIHEAFSKHVDLIVNTMSANESVRIAHHLADRGDVVLLSPACASFDLFKNYEDRGNQFKASVRNL